MQPGRSSAKNSAWLAETLLAAGSRTVSGTSGACGSADSTSRESATSCATTICRGERMRPKAVAAFNAALCAPPASDRWCAGAGAPAPPPGSSSAAGGVAGDDAAAATLTAVSADGGGKSSTSGGVESSATAEAAAASTSDAGAAAAGVTAGAGAGSAGSAPAA